MAITDITDDAPAFDTFKCLVEAEARLRSAQRSDKVRESLLEFEKRHFGPEVGAVRRNFNQQMLRHMDAGGRLLDYGCGGSWWKDDYWPLFDHITACEVDRSALKEIETAYPGIRLWWTRNGIIRSDEEFDVILSSSVLGYILPEQGRHHISCAYKMLASGGQLVVTRVLAFDIAAFARGRRLVDLPGPRFGYHYSKGELIGVLREAGFKDIRYVALGGRIPGLPWRLNQALYKSAPWLMATVVPTAIPFAKIQHMVTARK